MKKNLVHFLIVIASISSFSCSSRPSSTSGSTSATSDFDQWFYLFGTSSFQIRLFGATQENFDYLASYFEEMSDLTDAYNEPQGVKANLYTINHTNEPVVVDDKLAGVLQFALDMEKETKGYFNPLIGNLTNLWKDGINGIVNGIQTDTPYIPSDQAIAKAMAETSSSSLTLVGNTVTRQGTGIVDLGALAKGYSLREAEDYLAKSNVTRYIINAGTSSFAFGKTGSGNDWDVNFRDYPNAHFKCSLTSVGTSAVSEQSAVIDGKTYSHIVNPFTGSAEAKYVMASIKYPDPGLDDILSTVFMLVGEEGAKEYAKKYDGLGYAFYDGSTFASNESMGVYFV